MTIVVREVRCNRLYILLGTGFGMFRSERDEFRFLDGENVQEGERSLVCVTDRRGDILWFPSEEVKVVSVDGVMVRHLYEKMVDELDEIGVEEPPVNIRQFDKRGRVGFRH